MNKKVIVIVGIIAVVGIGYYMYNKSKASTETGDLGTGDGSQTTKSTTGKPLETRKDKKQACGRKPLLNKEKRALWEQCVASGGVASFDGDYGL
jgi:hypothetical protein